MVDRRWYFNPSAARGFRVGSAGCGVQELQVGFSKPSFGPHPLNTFPPLPTTMQQPRRHVCQIWFVSRTTAYQLSLVGCFYRICGSPNSSMISRRRRSDNAQLKRHRWALSDFLFYFLFSILHSEVLVVNIYLIFWRQNFSMEEPSVVRLRDQGTGREDSIFEDDRSFRRDPDSSTANLLVPTRPQSQRFHSHIDQTPDSQQGHTSRRWQFSWWLLTIILSAFICVAIKTYQSRGNFTSVQKHTFNTITMALTLVLGLNFFVSRHSLAMIIWTETNQFVLTQEAFKSVAKGSRSRILKLDNYIPRERELIFNIENLTDVIVLGWESSKRAWTKPWTTLLCIAWVRSPSRFVFCLIEDPPRCREF